jgi:hypothetical protein
LHSAHVVPPSVEYWYPWRVASAGVKLTVTDAVPPLGVSVSVVIVGVAGTALELLIPATESPKTKAKARSDRTNKDAGFFPEIILD